MPCSPNVLSVLLNNTFFPSFFEMITELRHVPHLHQNVFLQSQKAVTSCKEKE